MSTYRINFITTASLYVEVEADDYADAVEKAWEEMPATGFVQDPYDLGDWEDDPRGSTVDDEPVQL